MLSLFLAAALAAAPAPRAVADASAVVHIPRLDRLGGLHAFLERSGQQAGLLRPSVWYAELHPLVALDPSRPETLAEAGVDPGGPLTLSITSKGRVSCVRLSNPAAFQRKAGAVVEATGERKSRVVRGVRVVSAQRYKNGQVGYALKGKEACSFFLDTNWSDLLREEAERLVSRAPAADGRLGRLPGVLYVLSPGRGALGVDGSEAELRVEGLGEGLALPSLQGAGPSPYEGTAPEGLLLARARVVPGELRRVTGAVRALVQRACPRCSPEVLPEVEQALVPQLTGHAVWSVSEVKVKGTLRRPEVRLLAARQAVAVEVKEEAAARAALEPLRQLEAVKALEDGYVLEVEGGRVLVRWKGRHLVLGNDKAAVQALLEAVPAQEARLAHGLEFALDAKRVSRGLAQVSILDVTGAPMLVALFALGVELGPLLANSEHMTGWVDSLPKRAHRFSFTWTLTGEKR